VIGLSGGKDSVVLTQILHDTFTEDPRIELVGLTIHEGIEGYRDKSVEACVELSEELGIRHELVSYEEEFGVQMDDVVEDDPENMAPVPTAASSGETSSRSTPKRSRPTSS